MELLQPLLSMVLVFALLGACLWLLRRKGLAGVRVRGDRAGRTELLESRPLDASHRLHVVRVGNLELVLATYPGGCTLLGSHPAVPEEVHS